MQDENRFSFLWPQEGSVSQGWTSRKFAGRHQNLTVECLGDRKAGDHATARSVLANPAGQIDSGAPRLAAEPDHFGPGQSM